MLFYTHSLTFSINIGHRGMLYLACESKKLHRNKPQYAVNRQSIRRYAPEAREGSFVTPAVADSIPVIKHEELTAVESHWHSADLNSRGVGSSTNSYVQH
jgi:hypothetical protein